MRNYIFSLLLLVSIPCVAMEHPFFKQESNSVKLQDGSLAPESVVRVIIWRLAELLIENPAAFNELVAFCNNSNHKLSDNTKIVSLKYGELTNNPITRNIVLSAVKQDDEAAEVQDKHPEQNYELFCEMQKIRDFFNSLVEEAKAADPRITLAKTSREYPYQPNPNFDQTTQGLFVECSWSCGHPCALKTPWGKISLVGSVSGDLDRINEAFFKRVEVEPYIPYNKDFRPVTYRITKFKGKELPYAIPKVKQSEFLEYYSAMNIWQKFEERYKSKN